MIDPISAATAVALVGAGWLIGRHARLRRVPPKPVCMCGHHYGTHDPEDGFCCAEVRRTVNTIQSVARCVCVRYTGPQPVEQFWVPPSADMTIVTAPRPADDR